MPSKEGGDDATHTHNKEADFSLSLTHTSCTTLNKNNHYLGRTLPCRCISRQGLPAAAFYINSVSTAGPCSIASLPLQPPRSTTLAPSETICTAINVVSLVVMGPTSRSPDGQCGGTNSAEDLRIRHILLHHARRLRMVSPCGCIGLRQTGGSPQPGEVWGWRCRAEIEVQR